jgi:hypothetical protein
MKQILLVLFLTAMAAVGFVVTRNLSAPQTKPAPGAQTGAQAGQTNAQAGKDAGAAGKDASRNKAAQGKPKAADPAGPAAGDPQAAPKQGPAKLTPAMEAELAARASFDWRSSVDPDNVVRLDQAWSLDLSKVDFEAPILLYASGEPLTKAEFESFFVRDVGRGLFEARAARELSLWYARQKGIDGAFSEAEWEQVLAVKAERAKKSVDELIATWALSMSMPLAAAEALQRWSQEALIAYGLQGKDLAGLPSLFRTNVPGGDAAKFAEGMLSLIAEGWSELQTARATGVPASKEAISKLVGSTEGLAMFQTTVWHDELGYRVWTPEDSPLPEGVAGAVATGELPPSPVPAPWTWPGEVLSIPAAELYALVAPGQNRETLEQALADCLWFRSVMGRLKKEGLLEAPEIAWGKFEQEYSDSKRQALSMNLVRCSLDGFPTLRAYRTVTRLIDSYMASKPEGWDDLENLDAYFEKNRFFIEHWQPNLRLALFPPYDPRTPYMVADWAKSRADAEAMCAKVAAGEDFETLQREQNERISKALAESQGEEHGSEFRRIYGNLVALSANELNASLDESIYRSMLRGTTLTASATAHLDVGAISQPWRTPKGYVVARLEDATVGRLENEVEDLLPVVIDHYRSSHFKRYVNDTMRGLEITVP